MPAPRKHPQESRDRAIRLVNEAVAEDASLSLNAAVLRITPRVGVVAETSRGGANQVRVDQGLTPGTSTSDAARIKDFKR
jgi:transposase